MPLLGLDNEDGVDWDIVSVRSCARGVTAQNVFRMMAPASNMVMMYGIGGIGMTTMAPNALLMKAVMEASSNSREGTSPAKSGSMYTVYWTPFKQPSKSSFFSSKNGREKIGIS